MVVSLVFSLSSLREYWCGELAEQAYCTIMLIKTKINMEQKYVRITEPNLEEFLDAAFMKFSIPPPTEGISV
ncbi:unnamed protein product [Arctogadus glacialis]